MAGEFEEPWRDVDNEDCTHPSFMDAQYGESVVMSRDHYSRAAACVNALDGMDPAALAGLVASVETLLAAWERFYADDGSVNPLDYFDGNQTGPIGDALDALKKGCAP